MARVPSKRARCTFSGKIRYSNEGQARRQSELWGRTYMTPYKCKCGFWHLTSNKRTRTIVMHVHA